MIISLDEALRIVLNSARSLDSERVDLANALNRVLVEDVASDMDMPPFDKSRMDGYACRRADLAETLVVVGTIQAGAIPTKRIGPAQCAKIMTGAAIPDGADCVIMVEQTQSLGNDRIRFTGEQTPDHICRKAEDVRAGQVVLRRGTLIRPQHVAALASVGQAKPLVARQPRVAIVTGGDELVGPEAMPGPSQIRDSNGPQLAAQLMTLGITPQDYGIMRDDTADIERVLHTALVENDVVLISGGVSMGDFDLVPQVLRQNGVRLLFEKIAVKPGKPTVFGLSERAYCFGLPGNPVSTFTIFELLVRPFLYRLMGYDYAPVSVRMRLDESIARKDTERQSRIPVRRTSEEAVSPVEYHGSAHILALCQTDGLIHMETGVARVEKGTIVQVRLL
jgi:molybdopterin molybdotransferase